MDGALLLFAFVVTASALSENILLSQWNQFKDEHNKVYNSEEEEHRYGVFLENLKKIEVHNDLYVAGLKTYKMGVNQFADMTVEEFKNYLTLSGGNSQSMSGASNIFKLPIDIELPESIDYRQKGAVNPIKNQGICGSCWIFSVLSALESIYFLNTGTLYSLSEQNLADCVDPHGNSGCSGGSMESAYNYIRDNGIETEADYPNDASDGTCKFDKDKSVMSIKGYKCIQAGNETALQAAVATVGPVVVAVDASQWQFYVSGIFSVPTHGPVNHGVVIDGYGSENGADYWIVRNSWGPNWGEKGYILVARNDNDQVGIANDATYPDL